MSTRQATTTEPWAVRRAREVVDLLATGGPEQFVAEDSPDRPVSDPDAYTVGALWALLGLVLGEYDRKGTA